MKILYTLTFILSVISSYSAMPEMDRDYSEYFSDGLRRFDSCIYKTAFYNFAAAVIKSTCEKEKKEALKWKERCERCWKNRDTADYYYRSHKFENALLHYAVVVRENKNDSYCNNYFKLCCEKFFCSLKHDNMVFVQGGTFTMGNSNSISNEGPAHIVKLDGFYMDENEVTNLEYAVYLNITGSAKDSEGNLKIDLDNKKCKIHLRKGVFVVDEGYENASVTAVSWYGAEGYAVWAGKSLPSEAEWEYAFSKREELKISNLDSSLPEWCQDWYFENFYTKEKQRNPLPIEKSDYKVFRGSGQVEGMKTKRDFSFPNDCNGNIGFRCIIKKNI